MSEEYIVQKLQRGDIVEFPDNPPAMRYCVIYGGLGCITFSAGNKIDGFFGRTKEEAIKNLREGNIATTTRQRCKKLETIEVKREVGESTKR